jgi:hypothetical protein
VRPGYEIPKNNGRLVLAFALAVVALGALALLVLGFVDASIVAPEEIEPPAQGAPTGPLD